MSLYYTVRVYTENARLGYSVLVKNGGDKTHPWGTSSKVHAHRFLWKEEALDALRQFMSYPTEDNNVYSAYVRGQVFHVTEKPWGPSVSRQEEPPEAASEPETEGGDPEPKTLDLSAGEALLGVVVDAPDNVDAVAKLQLWLYANADVLLGAARERDRLNWLRMNPEGCRAKKDCRNKRADGYIHCADCLNDPEAGGYFDVYRNYYVQVYNDALDGMLEKINTSVGGLLDGRANQPESEGASPTPTPE